MSDSDIEGLIEQMGLDRAKRGPATPEQIRESMSVWTDEVRPRGYPNLFTTIEQFGEFSEGLRQLLNDYGISTEKVYVQGSSLSSTVPGDVDIAVVVSDQAFDSYVETAIDGIAARANPRAAERIIADLEAYAEKGLVPEFYFERLADGPSTSFAAHLRSSDFVPADIKLDVSIMRRSSSRLHPPILELP